LLNSHGNNEKDSKNGENIDDEVYPSSSTELHLSLTLLGVEDVNTSQTSIELSYSEHLKEQWSSIKFQLVLLNPKFLTFFFIVGSYMYNYVKKKIINTGYKGSAPLMRWFVDVE